MSLPRGTSWGRVGGLIQLAGRHRGAEPEQGHMALPRDAQTWPDLHQRPGTKPSRCACVQARWCGRLRTRWPDAQFAWSMLTHARGPNQGLRASLLGLNALWFEGPALCSLLTPCQRPFPDIPPLASLPSGLASLSCSSSTPPPVLVIFPLWDPSRQPQLYLCVFHSARNSPTTCLRVGSSAPAVPPPLTWILDARPTPSCTLSPVHASPPSALQVFVEYTNKP